MGKAHLTQAARSAKRYREEREKFYAAIRVAWAHDCSMIEIANAVSLSRQRVHQIIQAENSGSGQEVSRGEGTQSTVVAGS